MRQLLHGFKAARESAKASTGRSKRLDVRKLTLRPAIVTPLLPIVAARTQNPSPKVCADVDDDAHSMDPAAKTDPAIRFRYHPIQDVPFWLFRVAAVVACERSAENVGSAWVPRRSLPEQTLR
jgi:hypothetical protein